MISTLFLVSSNMFVENCLMLLQLKNLGSETYKKFVFNFICYGHLKVTDLESYQMVLREIKKLKEFKYVIVNFMLMKKYICSITDSYIYDLCLTLKPYNYFVSLKCLLKLLDEIRIDKKNSNVLKNDLIRNVIKTNNFTKFQIFMRELKFGRFIKSIAFELLNGNNFHHISLRFIKKFFECYRCKIKKLVINFDFYNYKFGNFYILTKLCKRYIVVNQYVDIKITPVKIYNSKFSLLVGKNLNYCHYYINNLVSFIIYYEKFFDYYEKDRKDKRFFMKFIVKNFLKYEE